MALVLLVHENLGKDKHVESLCFPRLDEGSIPSSSTSDKTYSDSRPPAHRMLVGGLESFIQYNLTTTYAEAAIRTIDYTKLTGSNTLQRSI